MRLFGGGDKAGSPAEQARTARHSSGWAALQSYLKEQEGLRILDVGPTSATNINLLTSLGHSIYMADLVGEADAPVWQKKSSDGEAGFDIAGYLQTNLPLTGRMFDVVLLWDAGDYLEQQLVSPLYAHLHRIMNMGGKLLSFCHIKPEDGFNRYHLRNDSQVDVQHVSGRAVQNIYTNRQMETLLEPFSTYRFFLAKDNLREVLVSR